MRWIQLALLASLTATVAAAEPLTLDEAVAKALAGSHAVAAADHTADAAAATAERARGFRLPSVDLTESFSRTNSPVEVFGMLLNQERFDINQFFMSDPNNPDALDTWMTRLEVTLPVYTGGQLGSRIEQADSMASAEQLRAAQAREQTAFDTITAYVNLAKAREQVDLLERARATTAGHLEIARSYAEQGLILSAEVLKAEVYLAQMDEMLATARNGARLAEAALNFHMGQPQDRHWTLTPLGPAPPVGGELADWVTAGLATRRDLEAARRELAAGRLEQDVARSAFKPEVALMGRYDLFDDTLLGANGHSGAIMAVARINLYHGGADHAAVAAAHSRAESGAENVTRFEEGIRLAVEQAWHDLETARLRLTTASESLDAAREALRVRESRFTKGLDRMIDLEDAETALREAELRELVARYDVALGTYRLNFVSGTSLSERVEESP